MTPQEARDSALRDVEAALRSFGWTDEQLADLTAFLRAESQEGTQ